VRGARIHVTAVDAVVEEQEAIAERVPDAPLVIAELKKLNSELVHENARLKHHLELLRRRIFGRSSEKGGGVIVAEQHVLPFEPVAARPVTPHATDEEEPTARPARRRPGGRRPLEKDLPRRRWELLPPATEMTCACCGEAKTPIGCDVTEELEYQPASFYINEYARPKLACPTCKDGVVQAILPPRPIEKGRPGAGLLAHVVASKYADHLPLYRQEQILARHGIEVTRRTLAEWNGAVADLLTPIVATMRREQVLRSAWIQCDDTGLEVQQPGQTPGSRSGHLWAYRDAEGDVVYDFTWARNRDGPLRMLDGYEGYLQADAAPAFDDVFIRYPQIKEVGCWAHARRYFKEAASSAALECTQVLGWIGELYGLERTATDKRLTPDARGEMRQTQSRPLLGKIRTYLGALALKALPKSPLGQAVAYARNHWTALTRYTEDGRLKIDNNGAEQALRPIVLGRKNWLTAGSEAAAHRTAVLCSLVQTCKHLGIDPFVYLREIIDRVSTHPASRILELTPREWKRLRGEQARSAA
jgi:transposase